MNKKDRTIKALEAFKKQVAEDWYNVSVGDPNDCEFCTIHRSNSNDRYCRGCPFAHEDGDSDCARFRAYGYIQFKTDLEIREEALADLDNILIHLQFIEPKRFTKNGWTYFKELENF